VLHGAFRLVGDIAVTAGTYIYAEESGGGRYNIAWEAMLCGGLQFLRGLFAAGRK
jgi:hypothetical protein